MEFFEKLALRTAPGRPHLWKPYVDDTFTLLKKGDVDELLVYFNSIHPSINLNMEPEEGGLIPFLETRVTKKVDGKVDVTAYRKPTHKDRYQHFNSHHPTHVKKRLEHHEGSIESSREDPSLWCLTAEWLPGSLRQSSTVRSKPRERDPE